MEFPINIIHIIIKYIGYNAQMIHNWDDAELEQYYKEYVYDVPLNYGYWTDYEMVSYYTPAQSSLTTYQLRQICQKFRKLTGVWSHEFIHDGLISITFTEKFNQLIKLPNGIKYVKFGWKFNQPVKLPDQLYEVKFGGKFNQPIELPDQLKFVEFGYDFNQRVKLPHNIAVVRYYTRCLVRITDEHGDCLVPRRPN